MIENFERNNYFYGKLLTAQDFLAEQNYFNKKRSVANRLLYGTGVVCGLNVLKADEQSVVIESGMAFDSTGREIVVGSPVVENVSRIEGFSSLVEKFSKEKALFDAYLCIEYAETPIEPIHSMAKTTLQEQLSECEHNKIREGFSLFLTDTEQPLDAFEPYGLVVSETVIWDDENARVIVKCPKYAKSGEEFLLKCKIIKKSPKCALKLSFQAQLSFLTSDGERSIEVAFEEPEIFTEDIYTVSTPIKAQTVGMGKILISRLAVEVFGEVERSDSQFVIETEIAEDLHTHTSQKHAGMSLQDSFKKVVPIYIAKLRMLVSPEYHIIDSISWLPFNQTVHNPIRADSLAILEGFAKHPSEKPTVAAVSRAEEASALQCQMGSVNMSIPLRVKKGKVFFSDWIPHGLGVGLAFVEAGLHTETGIAFDNAGVIQSEASWGIELNRDEGTFRIGVNPLAQITECKFSWFAKKIETEKKLPERTISIIPNVYHAARKETVRFEVTVENGAPCKDGELEWSVFPESGGRINNKGIFTAYNEGGLFEIQVKSILEPKLRASAFVVIK